MKLVIGLGNPGKEYLQTRHNLGYMVVDGLAEQMRVSLKFEKKLKADVAMLVHNHETLILAKPQTFMNLSGDCVSKITSFYKVATEDIWVISDDLDLDFGKVRVRVGGSSGGHNGLKDIIEKVSEGFTRYRVGVKNPMLEKMAAEKFVLQRFSAEESEKLPDVIQKTTELILDNLENGIEHSSHQIKAN